MRVTLLSEVLLCYQKKKKKLTLWIVNFYIMLMIFLFIFGNYSEISKSNKLNPIVSKVIKKVKN